MDQRVAILGSTAVLAAAGSAAGILLLGGHGGALCRPFVHAATPPAARAALARYAGRIEYRRSRANDGSSGMSWSDPVTGRTRQLTYDSHRRLTNADGDVVRNRVEHSIWVMYDGRAWIADTHRLPAAAERQGPANEAQTNRDLVANGRAAVLGTVVVDGRRTLHLRQVIHAPALKAPPSAHLGLPASRRIIFPPQTIRSDIWVDPITYLTVRARVGTRRSWSVTDERWLPRTPATVAKTRLAIPPGFRHVASQNGTDVAFFSEIAAGGCGGS